MNDKDVTCLGGTLRRVDQNQWEWIDGTPEPRVRDLLRNDLAPNFRVIGGRNGDVEIPRNWRDYVDDPAIEMAIEWLIKEHGRPADIFGEGIAEALDEHRVFVRGYRVPVKAWDEVMKVPTGAQWDIEHEEDILQRADMLRKQMEREEAENAETKEE